MGLVRAKDTKPERLIRSLIRGLGGRVRLHDKALPGSPDLSFPSRKKAVFVHGCFWHGHFCPRGKRLPKSNTAYWRAKIARNIARDTRDRARLRRLKWGAMVVWECGLKNKESVTRRLVRFLGAAPS